MNDDMKFVPDTTINRVIDNRALLAWNRIFSAVAPVVLLAFCGWVIVIDRTVNSQVLVNAEQEEDITGLQGALTTLANAQATLAETQAKMIGSQEGTQRLIDTNSKRVDSLEQRINNITIRPQ